MNRPLPQPLAVSCAPHGDVASPWRWGPALLAAAGLFLVACASPPPPPPLLHLPTDGPSVALPVGTAPPQPWRLGLPILLPAASDRDAVMVASGAGQWVPWLGLRWSEPLRDALPRVLAADLAAWHGAPVWTGPAMPGLPARPVLTLQIDDWEASLPDAMVHLQARWTLSPPVGSGPVQQGRVRVQQPWPQATASGLVQAQRAALHALARQVVAQAAAASAGAGGP